MDPQLPGFLGSMAPILSHYGYLAVFVVVFVESFGVPAPGQTILIAAAVYAGAGHLNVVVVAMLGLLAAVVGDIGFLIGRHGGRPLLLRFGGYLLLTEERLHKVESLFARHGNAIVAGARFVDGLRQFNGLVAGMVRMPPWRFLTFNALGALAWVGMWTSLGYLAGHHLSAIYDGIRHYQVYLLTGLGCLLVAGLVALVLGRRHRRWPSHERHRTSASASKPWYPTDDRRAYITRRGRVVSVQF
jgi:membrane protein DedA with SNARE-associated domain